MNKPNDEDKRKAAELVENVAIHYDRDLQSVLFEDVSQLLADARADTVKGIREAVDGQRNPLPQPDTPRGVDGSVWQGYLNRNAYRNEVLNQVVTAIDRYQEGVGNE